MLIEFNLYMHDHDRLRKMSFLGFVFYTVVLRFQDEVDPPVWFRVFGLVNILNYTGPEVQIHTKFYSKVSLVTVNIL